MHLPAALLQMVSLIEVAFHQHVTFRTVTVAAAAAADEDTKSSQQE
jgi:hypothetical protein